MVVTCMVLINTESPAAVESVWRILQVYLSCHVPVGVVMAGELENVESTLTRKLSECIGDPFFNI